MARQQTVLNLFISSPKDLSEDRDTVEEVVEEINTSLSSNLGVRFVTLRWETSVTPGIGSDPQAVINAAIGGDYDVFVGIMGSRFGQPTPRFGSGTEEEFANAYKRHLAEPGSLRVLFYFKDTPLHPSKINPKELLAVNEFRATLSSKGVLFCSYSSRDEFRKLLRIHLSEILQTWNKKNEQAPCATTQTPRSTKQEIPSEDEEPGFLDLLADIQDDFDSLNSTAEHLTAAMNNLTAKVKQRTSELETATKAEHMDFRHVKRICAGIAQDMDEYCARTEPELNLFSQTHARLMDRTIKVVSSIRADGKLKQEEVQTLETSLERFAGTLAEVTGQLEYFRNSVAALPRATTVFNKARNRTVRLVDRLVETVNTAGKLTSETHRLMGAGAS